MAETRGRGERITPLLALVAALVIMGCGGNADPTPEPHLVLGTGRMEYEPLTDGQEVPLYMGPQGGWHVYGGVQAYGVPPEGATLHYWLSDPDTGATVSLPRTILLGVDQVLDLGDHWERYGDTVIINGQGPDFVGRTFDLHVEIVPAEGATLTDVRSIAIVEGPVL